MTKQTEPALHAEASTTEAGVVARGLTIGEARRLLVRAESIAQDLYRPEQGETVDEAPFALGFILLTDEKPETWARAVKRGQELAVEHGW